LPAFKSAKGSCKSWRQLQFAHAFDLAPVDALDCRVGIFYVLASVRQVRHDLLGQYMAVVGVAVFVVSLLGTNALGTR
jgi:hypothetical protein